MTAISTAIGVERRSRVSGYKIKKGFFNEDTPNLPQIIAILGEANTANQGTLSTDKKEITSAQEAGETYGFGSPIHSMMRILRPIGGDGVGGIPTIVFPQATDGGATASQVVITVTGTATSNSTHNLLIAGRLSLDFQSYAFSVATGDTPTLIAEKIVDAVNGVIGSPVSAANVLGVVTFTTKWKGATSAEVKVSVDTGNNLAGLTYAQTSATAGAGAVDLAAALAQFGSTWYTIVINPYGVAQLSNLEAFNGIPDDDAPTGRFVGDVFKPFISMFGSVLSDKDDLATITNDAARIGQVTNVLCPAPASSGMSFEAAANAVAVHARIAQDVPHLDVNNKSYPDMPAPSNGIIGDMADYNNRDFLVKKGCSTVILDKGAYIIQDFVTTYHPEGEIPLQYAYVRNINIDRNVAFGYKILEEITVKDHVLVADGQVTDAAKSVKPKQWKAVLYDYLDSLAVRALLNNPQFSKDSLIVQVSVINPDRFETTFRYKRTGIARIESTDVEAGF
jgi:phage tail sheath gpL-like